MGLARGKGESTWRQVELGDAITRLGQTNHQRRPPKGWGVVSNSTQ
jgi:hypothetical protein